MRRSLTIFSLLLSLAFSLQAQVTKHTLSGLTPSTGSGQAPQPSTPNSQLDTMGEMPKGIVFHTDIPDSTLSASVFSFRRLPCEVKIMSVSHPAFNPTGVQHSDPLNRHDGNYYLEAGGLGHPHYGVFPNFSAPLGIQFKPTLFPAYYKTPQNVAFYQVQRPYTLLAYHSSLKKDYQLHVTHSQNITERWNFAIDYHLFSPEGVYANSSAVNHLLDFNTNYYSRDGRYQVRGGAIWQRFTLGENGGITNDDAFIYKRITNPSGIPVADNSASSRTNDLTLYACQSYNTVRQVPWYKDRMVVSIADSIGKLDTTYITDTLYPSAPRILNTGVFGLDFQYDRQKYYSPTLNSQFSILNSQFSILNSQLYWTNDAYLDHRWRNPLKATLGVRPCLAVVTLDSTQLSIDSTRSSTSVLNSQFSTLKIYPFARVAIAPWRNSKLIILTECEPTTGEYNFDGTLSFTASRSLLQLRATAKASCSDNLQFSILNSQFSTPLMKTARIEASYRFGDLLDIALVANNIQNYYYYTKDQPSILTPQVSTLNSQLYQARLRLNLEAWSWFHLDMQQLLQYTPQQFIHVPLFASKNSLYADFYMFRRALRTQVGVDLRYHTAFYADAYDPTYGLFYRQSDTKVGNYIYADLFINLQIKRASIYVKAGHLNSLLESEAHYYTLPHYPGNPFGLFYGLTWQFFD